jgi:Zn-dependent protease
MAVEPEVPPATPSPNRLWAEQLAMGLALLLGLLIFMALAHPKMLSSGAAVFGPNYMGEYGLASVVGVVMQIVVHELGSILALWRMKVPIRLRFFGFGANATAALEPQPRDVWRDARVGIAGPLAGTILSVAFAGIYEITKMQDMSPVHVGDPFFLGMACVGYFYNLFTLIPILDLEGGWIAPAVAPQAWLLGLVASVLELTNDFNLVLLGVVSFALPRFFLLLRARAPRTDVDCTNHQRVVIGVGYFLLVIGLAWLSSTTFAVMPELVRNAMGD